MKSPYKRSGNSYPIKGTFKSFYDYVKITGHNDKEIDPKQYIRINTDEKVLYLTFDTCPTPDCDFEIVNWLLENKIPATIFLNIGWYKENYSKGLQFLENDLFEIGGHGYYHERPMRQSYAEQTADIDACVNFIYNEFRKNVKWYRSPYGKPNEDTISILDSLGIKYASWAGHVFDKAAPEARDPNEASKNYMENFTKPGDIWIFHINKEGQNSFEVLKNAYNWAMREGYRFEKLPS